MCAVCSDAASYYTAVGQNCIRISASLWTVKDANKLIGGHSTTAATHGVVKLHATELATRDTNCHTLPCFTVVNQPCIFIVMLFRARTQNQKFRNKTALNIRKYSSELLHNPNNFALASYFERKLN